jgi:Parvulin-like peptidyl-prolyl isomerase
MTNKSQFTGTDRNARSINFRHFSAIVLVIAAGFLASCGGTSGGANAGDNETAATVNGKAIKMEDVERAVKQQAQGQESRLSPLELASARLQVLESLIQQEVMFQKAEKENAVPTDEEITAEINKEKTQSGKSADQIEKDMRDSGMTEPALREQVKKQLAIQKLVDKITGKIEPPKDAEIEAFYNGNKDAFVKKRGVKLAAIVIDPANNGEGDTTVDDQSAMLKVNDIGKKLQAGQDFSQLARENSEDQSRFQGGDLGYIAEDDLKQTFPEQVAADLMNPNTPIGKMLVTRVQGKIFIIKLQDRSDKDEAVNLDSPGVRQQVTDSLVNSRKQLLAASYQAIAMNEARIENLLAKKVVDNPNELSGARPASAGTPAASPAANTNAGSVTNLSNANSGSTANTAATPKTSAPVSTPAARPAATPKATAPAAVNANRP